MRIIIIVLENIVFRNILKTHGNKLLKKNSAKFQHEGLQK